MDWHPIQGPPRLVPQIPWDRLQAPCDPLWDKWYQNGWMDLCIVTVSHFLTTLLQDRGHCAFQGLSNMTTCVIFILLTVKEIEKRGND